MLPRTGDLLGRKYRLGTELGRGAMGIVYEARHETLDQPVAIKILRAADLEDREAAVRRFEREARIIAKLDSGHVVKVIDVDRTDDGVPYLVMERLAGRDLAAEVEARGEARVPLGEAVTWMAQVCAAMVVAHEAGVVHRDLKLSNVFLGEDGVVKVLDFGVAVLKHGDAERSITTSLAGTPRYMAPEQLLGESPNPASDVWAIGVMLYRLLGGRFPFDAPTMAAQMLAMMHGCPPLATLAPDLPRTLAAVVQKALGHGLDERWRSAKELAEALAPFVAGEAAAGAAAGAAVKANANANAEADATADGDADALAEAEARARAKARAEPPRLGWRAGVVLVLLAAGVGVRALATRGDAPAVNVSAQADAARSSSRPGAVDVMIEPVTSAASSATATATATAIVAPPSSSERRVRPNAGAVRPRASASEKAAAPAPSESSEDGFPAHL